MNMLSVRNADSQCARRLREDALRGELGKVLSFPFYFLLTLISSPLTSTTAGTGFFKETVMPWNLNCWMRGDEIVVSLPGTSYAVAYYKPGSSPQLLARHLPPEGDDPRLSITRAEFLAQAWRLANDKARELGWIV
jgi:hypothetical protein